MSGWQRTASLAAVVLALSGCTHLAPVFDPGPWDGYGNAGPLPVRGEHRDTAGPVIFQALRREKRLAAVLTRQGEPDFLEVHGSRFGTKQIVLVYRRPPSGRPRRIVLDPTSEGYVARAPEPLVVSARRVATRRAPAAEPPPAAAGDPELQGGPTTTQSLECPIDPMRPDCQALCSAAVTYEWCQ